MQTIDMHCDTLSLSYVRGYDKLPEELDIFEMPGSVDLKRLHESGAMAQFFAAFLPPVSYFAKEGIPFPGDDAYIAFCKRVLDSSLAKHGDIAAPARTAEEIRQNFAQGKVSAVFTLEDGRAVDGRMEKLRQFHAMGVRAIALTWNFENCFGAPNSRDPAVMQKGLTAFGREAVVYMQQLGILVDVSHLSDGGFYDVARLCKKPFVATHSNCRALSAHPRNLTDEMLRLLGEAGGVAGLNFAPEFLNPDPANRASTAERMAAHARHIADVGGMDCVALGSDFDGITGELEIGDPTQMDLLADALHKQSFTQDQIDQIFYGNALRVLAETIG